MAMNRKRADKVVVLVTCGMASEARRIADRLVKRRLAACVNVFPGRVRSTYRWKGKVEIASEYFLLIKSTRELFPALRAEVERLHSYAVPEVIALPIEEGAPAYLRWLADAVRGGGKKQRSRAPRRRAGKKNG